MNHPVQPQPKSMALYPQNIREALRRWDADEPVHTIKSAIDEDDEIVVQTVMFELLRDFQSCDLYTLSNNWFTWSCATVGRIQHQRKMKIRGRQVEAAKKLAVYYLQHGYREALQNIIDWQPERLIKIVRRVEERAG